MLLIVDHDVPLDPSRKVTNEVRLGAGYEIAIHDWGLAIEMSSDYTKKGPSEEDQQGGGP